MQNQFVAIMDGWVRRPALGGCAVSGPSLNRALVLRAVGQSVEIADLAGCRLFMVHPARPELVGYYAKFGFVEVETTPSVMVMSLVNARAVLDAVKNQRSLQRPV